jgi:copper chaperone CopZ
MEKTLIVEGMSCEHCEKRTEKELLKIDAVSDAKANADQGQVVVNLSKEIADDKLAEAVSEAGYDYIKTV